MDGLRVFIGGNVDGLKKSIREADYAIKGFVNKNKQALKSLENIGAPAAIAFAGLTLGVAASVKKFGEFEATMNRVAAVSGASASELAALKKQAEDLGAATKFSGQEAASGMEELAKAGFTAKQTMDAIPGVLQLAAAGGVSVAQAAELAGGTIRGFGLAMDEAGRVADVMAQAANQSSVDIGDLQLTMKYVAPVASSASQSLEEMSGAIAIMGNSMIKGEQAGTTLRAALTRLQDPPKEAGETLAKLGIAISDTQGRMLPLGDIVDQLRTKTAKMTEVQRNAAIAQIFGTEALSGMLTLVKASPSEYQAMVDSMRNADGAAKKMSDTINSGFVGAMDQLGASVESSGLAIGENLAPAILAVAGVVKGAVDGFNALDPAFKTIIIGAGAGTTALIGMVGAAGLLLPVLANVRSALFAMNTLALTPVGATIAALAVTVGVATMAFKAFTDASKAASAQQGRTSDEVKQTQDQVQKLAREYDVLAAKTNLTAAEKERLRKVLDELNKLAPGVVTGYDGMGNAMSVNKDALDRFNSSLGKQLDLLIKIEQQERLTAVANRDSARMKAFAAFQDLQGLEKELEQAQLASPTRFYDPTGKTAAVESNAVKKLRDRIAQQQALLSTLDGQVRQAEQSLASKVPITPKASAGTSDAPRARGGAYSLPPAKAKGGKSEAERAAEELHRQQVDQLGKLSAAYQRSLQVAQAWGGGTAAEVKSLTAMIAEIRTKGLDKIPEGYEAIINAETRLKVIQGERIVAGIEAEKKAADDRAKHWRKAEDEITAYVKKHNEDQAAARLKSAEAFKDAIGDMQGEIIALATDPSLERIANFAKGLAQDGKKAAEWGDAIKKIGDDFKNAGEGAKGFEAALSSIGGAINPLSFALTAAIGLANTLKDALEKAFAAPGLMLDSVRSVAREIRRAQVAASGDPMQRAAFDRENAVEDLNEKAAAELKKRKEALKARPENQIANVFSNGARFARIDSMTEADFADIQQMLTEGMAGIDEAYNKAVFGLVDTTAEGAAQGQETIERAFEAYEGMLDRLGEIDRELNEGGRDAYGHKITLELEHQQKVLEQQEENAKRLNALTDRKLKLETDLRQLKVDEAKAIADIENEGIAVRALSEAQDKGIRIEKVKTDYAKKRLDITDELTKVNDDITQATLEAEQALSRINIQYQERIDALVLEAERLTDNVAIAQQQLGIERSITDEIKRRQSIQSSGGGGSSSVPSQRSTPGAATGSTTYRQQYFHTGGTVPGLKSDEVPAILRANEFVFTPRQFEGLMDLRAAAARGGPSFGDVSITVHAAPGMNERQVADAVWSTISTRLRRAGLGR